jgi:hypothetical protein
MTNVDLKWKAYMEAFQNLAQKTYHRYVVMNASDAGGGDYSMSREEWRSALDWVSNAARAWCRAKHEHEKKYGAEK